MDDKVNKLLTAYFHAPYEDYGEMVLEIHNSGGLNSEEVNQIEKSVLLVDANTIIRHSGRSE